MNSTTIDLNGVREYIFSLLPEVSGMLLEFFNSRNFTKKTKGKFDFATTADLETDLFLIRKLKEKYPGIPFLTEESEHVDMEAYKHNDLMWVIDPLDGTHNFAKGDTNFACSIALTSNVETLIGVCLQPVAKKIFWAQKDREGAYGNGNKIRIPLASPLEEVGINTNWSHFKEGKKQIAEFMSYMIQHIRTIRLQGCAVNDLLAIIEGKTDVYFDTRHMPWDAAAASFILQKAGAKITDGNGKKYSLFTPSILAAHPVVHSKILDLLSHQKAA